VLCFYFFAALLFGLTALIQHSSVAGNMPESAEVPIASAEVAEYRNFGESENIENLIIEVDPLDQTPAILHSGGFRLPDNLRSRETEVIVKVRLVIGISGDVKNLRVENATDGRYIPYVEASLRKWRFTPPMRRGSPVEAWILLPIVFPKADAFAGNQSASELIPLSQLDKSPVVLKRVRPVLPIHSGSPSIIGSAMIEALVDENGNVVSCKTVETNGPECAEKEEAAVLQWKFAPCTVDGNPASFSIRIHVVFRPEDCEGFVEVPCSASVAPGKTATSEQ